MSRKIKLLIIDPNNDFVKPDGALSVPGADKASTKIANLIDQKGHKLIDIDTTLDSHQYLHIANPPWFVDKDKNNPNPFTLIRVEDDKIHSYDPASGDVTGEYFCNILGQEKWTLDYLKALEQLKIPHCVWNPHCIIGTPGHAVYGEIEEALHRWCLKERCTVNFLTKGSNPRTEHFSAIKAQVQDPNDPTTGINAGFMDDLQNCDELAIAGFAENFCLASTMYDVLDIAGEEFIKKCVLLEDCTAGIPGFEHLTENFRKTMKSAGMQFVKSDDYL